LGTTYGTTSPGYFKLPDYRGYFLRGAGVNVDGTAGEIVGQKQVDTVGPITVPVEYKANANIQPGSGNFGGYGDKLNTAKGGSNIDINQTLETRPKNISVLYIISTGR
jgi:hypothetical protein